MQFQAMVNKDFKRNVNSNGNETDKINSISENLTEIKVKYNYDIL